jgi:hypothetical protein
MKKIVGTAVVAVLLVGCGGGGSNTETCKALADLEALVKPDGYNFDTNNDGYMNAGELFNEASNKDLKQDLIDLRETYPDC